MLKTFFFTLLYTVTQMLIVAEGEGPVGGVAARNIYIAKGFSNVDTEAGVLETIDGVRLACIRRH